MSDPRRPGIYECRWDVPNEQYLKDADEPERVERSCFNFWDGTRWHHGLSSLRAYKNVVTQNLTIPLAPTDGWRLLAWKGKS